MADDADYPAGCQPIKITSNNSELIKRLRTLADSLHDCPPNKEYGEPTRFLKLFRHLSNQTLMDNNNSDVQIYLGICLASILRLYVPEVPAVDVLQIKETYFFLFRTLRSFGDITTESPMFKRYHYFMDLISVIIQPLIDVKETDEKEAFALYRSLIKSALSIPCGKGWSKSVKNGKKKIVVEEGNEEGNASEEEAEEEEAITSKIVQMLITIASTPLHELDYVPNSILDVLFFYITEPQKTHYPDACFVAQEVIKKSLNQVVPAIQNVLHTAILSGELPSDFEMTGSANRSKFYDVLRALHHIGHDLVATALPFLSRWLQAESESDRQQAVKLIGLMTREKMCQFGLSSDDVTWKAFLNSSMDESVEVRRELVKQSKNVLISNHSQLRGPITNCLLHLFKDADDGIRELCITTVVEVAKIKLEAVSDKLLSAANMRIRDKRSKVRLTSVKNLMSLYHHVMTSSPLQVQPVDGMGIEGNTNVEYTDSDRQCIEFIPNSILLAYRYSQKLASMDDVRLLIERYFQLYFVPYKVEAGKRVELMATLFRSLNESSIAMFNEIVSRSSQVRRAIIGIVKDVSTPSGNNEKAEGSAVDKSSQLKERIRRLSLISSESHMLEKVLLAFVNQLSEDEETFGLMKYLISDDYTTDEIESTARRLLYRTIEKKTVLGSQPAQMTAFRRFVDRCSPLSMDPTSAKALLDFVANTVIGLEQKKKSSEEHFARDIQLLKIWCEHFPHLFKSDENLERVRKDILNSDEPQAVEVALGILISMFTKSSFRQRLESEEYLKTKLFRTLIDDLKSIILQTDPKFRKCCKLATRLSLLMFGEKRAIEMKTFDETVDELISNVDIQHEGCANALQALGEIYYFMPEAYQEKVWLLMDYEKIGKGLILSHKVSDEILPEFDSSLPLEQQPWPKFTMAKVYAIKFAARVFEGTYRLRSKDQDPTRRQELMETFSKYVKWMVEVFVANGAVDDIENSEVERARLRAVAGSSLLKLCYTPAFRARVDACLFKHMSYLVLDEALCVRSHYLRKVKKGMGSRLPVDFAACFGLVNLGKNADEVDKAEKERLNNFKIGCLTNAVNVFSQRSESVADQLKLTGGERTMFCAETVVIYTIWLLANYKPFQSVDDVSLLAEMQECLWVVLDALKTAKCNMQIVGKALEIIKKYGDRPKRDATSPESEELHDHNKKLWALSDLGTMMLMYRAKIQINDDLKDAGVNRQFFYVCGDKADPSEVYAPDVLIEDEKQRNGKLPKGVRQFNTLNTSKRAKPATSTAANTTKKRGRGAAKTANDSRSNKNRKAKNYSIFETPEEEEEDDDNEEVFSRRTRVKRGKPSVFDIPEEEEEEEEEMPSLKRSRRNDSATASVEEEDDDEENETPPKKTKKVVIKSPVNKGKQNGKDESLTNLELSPIEKENGVKPRGRGRAAAKVPPKKPAKLMSSTPMRVDDKKTVKSKKKQNIVEEEEEEEEEIVEPKRRSGRKPPTKRVVEEEEDDEKVKENGSAKDTEEENEEVDEPEPKRKSGRKTAAVAKKKESPKKSATREGKKKDVFDIPIDEDEDAPAPATRRSTRNRK